MPKAITLIGVAAFAGLLVYGGMKLRDTATVSDGWLEGHKAPGIALTTLEGKSVSLDEMKGKVVLVDFWATWCPPCRASLPHIQKLATDSAMAQKGLVVWAINAGETDREVRPFMEQNKYTFTVPMDVQNAAQQAYRVEGIPMTVLIGRDGLVRKVFVGYNEAAAAQIDVAVEKALRE